jgi:hypothetical protein
MDAVILHRCRRGLRSAGVVLHVEQTLKNHRFQRSKPDLLGADVVVWTDPDPAISQAIPARFSKSPANVHRPRPALGEPLGSRV